jgi:hypothetical protein
VATEPITVAEVDPFEATARKAGMTETERGALVDFLARNPEAGAVIRGTGGLRKLRWARPGTGKSGGYRAICYFLDRQTPIFLLAVYAKAKKDDLESAEKKQLAELAAMLKAHAKSLRRVR